MFVVKLQWLVVNLQWCALRATGSVESVGWAERLLAKPNRPPEAQQTACYVKPPILPDGSCWASSAESADSTQPTASWRESMFAVKPPSRAWRAPHDNKKAGASRAGDP